MLPSIRPSCYRNHVHFEVSMEVCMCQGASTMFLSTLFWNLCIMAVLLGFVHHHSCMPQASISVCRAPACYASTGPIFCPLASTRVCILGQALPIFS